MGNLVIGIILGVVIAGYMIQSERHEQRIVKLSERHDDQWREVNSRLIGIIDGGGGDANNQPSPNELLARLRSIADGGSGISEGEGGGEYRGSYGRVGDDPTDEAWPTPPSDGLRNRVAMVEPGVDLITELTGMRNDGVPHDLSGEMYEDG